VSKPCAGCLDKGSCGVCLGYGLLDIAKGEVAPCHRCYGTGRCWLCQEISLGDLGDPPELSVGVG
jgi:hypothetical protein